MAEATCSAPINLAIIKYWGKRDTKLILPTNSSLSVTLSQDHLRSTTTIRADETYESDKLWLNGKEEVIAEGRLRTCIDEMRRLRRRVEDQDSSLKKISALKIHIVSANNFPTAAGLASSASGFAALVSTLSKLYELPITPSELSLIARQGSGSACRSVLGGFVAWEMGSKSDGSDSRAIEIEPQQHWPDLHAVICVVSDAKKGTASTAGMQRTVETSSLLQHRIHHVVPRGMIELTDAIKRKDFDKFASIAMADSNNFHACCLDTVPPIFYLNDTSKAIINLIVERNRVEQAIKQKYFAAYTFDAGPNAVIFTPKENAKELVNLLASYFPVSVPFDDPFKLFTADSATAGSQPIAAEVQGFDPKIIPVSPQGAVSRLIHTTVGDGPRHLDSSESLIGPDGLPK